MADNYFTVIGFGSLLSEKDAKRTCPNLKDFRYGYVENYARVFSKVDSNLKDYDREHIANWAFFPMIDHKTLVTIFEIPEEEYIPFVAREMDYHLKSIPYVNLETGIEGQGIACCAFQSNDDFVEYLKNNPIQSDLYIKRYGEKYRGSIWRDDILPCNKYLSFVLSIAHGISAEYIHNILDEGYLADRTTKLREYLQSHYTDLPIINELDFLENYLFKTA